MDALREGVYLRSYAQKDPLVEYKTEAYDMFVELMANIKNEVLHNLFRSTSNLQAFENFLSTLPQFLLREHAPRRRRRPGPSRAGEGERLEAADGVSEMATVRANSISRRCDRDVPKVGRNEPAPAAAGRNSRTAAADGVAVG